MIILDDFAEMIHATADDALLAAIGEISYVCGRARE